MKIVKKPLSELTQTKTNSRKHPTIQIQEFKRSIERFGVIRPLVVDEEGTILVGNGLFQALSELGRESADVIVAKGLSENEKKKLILSDNKIFSLGVDNFDGIDELLRELAIDSDFEIPGYDAETLDALYGIESVEADAESEASEREFEFEPKRYAGEPFERSPEAEPAPYGEAQSPSPSRATVEARKEAMEAAGRFIICPHCGERIDL